MKARYDVLIVGGGVNGTGIARDLSGRGISVLLVEAGDLASATSSASSKILHGGLRYLEQYEFRLVREALKEREVLLKNAPHIMWPLEFILPYEKHMRPKWMIRIGLFIYDNLAKRNFLPSSHYLRLKEGVYGSALKDTITEGFSYADGWVDDARLVTLNAVDARDKGADILNYTSCVSLTEKDDEWHAKLQDSFTGKKRTIKAKMIVNAAGPWVNDLLGFIKERETPPPKNMRLVKGSHIIVPKLFEGEHAYILQNKDGRIVFVFSYEGNFSLIGTTDVVYKGDPAAAKISQQEKDYLCGIVNDYFKTQIQPKDIVSSYSGVRPLLDDGEGQASKVTRDYKLHLHSETKAPLLSLYGGKITTFRKLSENASDIVAKFFSNSGKAWTAEKPLPGGDLPEGSFEAFVAQQRRLLPWLPATLIYRYARAYGTRIKMIIGDAKDITRMGQDLGDGVYGREIDYLIQHEFARNVQDVLWRRSKLGLHISEQTVEAIRLYINSKKEGSA